MKKKKIHKIDRMFVVVFFIIVFIATTLLFLDAFMSSNDLTTFDKIIGGLLVLMGSRYYMDIIEGWYRR